MWFNKVGMEVWRYTAPSGFVPETYTYYTTISGTFMPLAGSDAIRNNQNFADVKKLFVCDISYKGLVSDDDECEINDKWFRIRTVEAYENILPHLSIYLGDSQWERTV